ncbi:hypothetical protein ACRRTK_013423 [Alexandromys fortis]
MATRYKDITVVFAEPLLLSRGFLVGTSRTTNSFQKEEFDCPILDEVFTAKDILDQNIHEVSSSDDKEAFYVADLGGILRNHLRRLKALPRALSDDRFVFDMGTDVGFSMYLLDIGGGFPGSEGTEGITSVINPALDKCFPPDSWTAWKERTSSDDEDESNEQTSMHYVNDGVHGSFNCILYDHTHVKALLPKRPKPDEKYYSSSVWGPTHDGLDWIECCNLPDMHVGGWLLWENMGAYTVAAASTFSGFQRPSVYYVMSRLIWQLTKQIQSLGFPPEVEEQDVGTLPMSCARESGMDRHPAACASASISRWHSCSSYLQV